MPDFTSIPALDVAIGLAFLYFLLSTICSAISEIIASLFKMRARNLEVGIRTLLGSKKAAETFYADWRIQHLRTPRWLRKGESRKPSYIPSRTFALAVIDTLAPEVAKAAEERDAEQAPAVDMLEKLRKSAAKVDDRVGTSLTAAVDGTREQVDAFRKHLEDAFNDVMDRATGWYKRKVQLILFFVALAVAGGMNADTFNVADRLARDDALRAAVVAQAQKSVEDGSSDGKADTAEEVEKQIDNARATALPLGWNGENVPDGEWYAVVLLKAGGILVTALALMLGAPFWFDLLGRFTRVRSSGNRIGTPKSDETAAVDRDDRSSVRSRQGNGNGSTDPPPPISET